MVELLDVLDAFVVPPPPDLKPSSLKFFRGVDWEVCRGPAPSAVGGRRPIDLVALHRLLLDSRARAAPRLAHFESDSSSAAEADEVRRMVAQKLIFSSKLLFKLRLVLTSALHQNQHEEAQAARLHLFDAWRKVLEVALLECYPHLVAADAEPHLFGLLELLLAALLHSPGSPPLREAMADVCLVIIAKLRGQPAALRLPAASQVLSPVFFVSTFSSLSDCDRIRSDCARCCWEFWQCWSALRRPKSCAAPSTRF